MVYGVGGNAVDIFCVIMMTVVAELVEDVNEDEHAAGKADGQAGDVDEGEEFVAEEVPPGGDEEVFEHKAGLMGKEEQRVCGNGEERSIKGIWMRDSLICSVLEEGVFGNGRNAH